VFRCRALALEENCGFQMLERDEYKNVMFDTVEVVPFRLTCSRVRFKDG